MLSNTSLDRESAKRVRYLIPIVTNSTVRLRSYRGLAQVEGRHRWLSCPLGLDRLRRTLATDPVGSVQR